MTTTTTTVLDLDELAAALGDRLLLPGTPGYAAEVSGFNLAHQPAPRLVVAATSAEDVALAVRHAAAHGLPVRAQATGHGLVDELADVLLVSTKALGGVHVDPATATARVGAGVRWAEVVAAAAPHGLAPLSGSSSGVGVVGYTLGGGIGLLARRHGFAADSVRALTVVTGDGAVARVTAEEHPDLFWALRGAKAGFGVVTEIELELVPVTRVHGGGLFFPGSEAAGVLDAWRTWSADLPEEVTTSVALLRLPPDPHLPPPLQGQFVVHVRYAHLGDAAAAAALLAPLRSAAPVLLDTVGELPYAAADAVHMDPPTPLPAHDRGLALAELTRETVDALLAVAGPASDSVLTLVELRLLGGALARPAAVPSAVTGRDAAYGVYVLGVPAGPGAAAVPAQVDAVVAALAPWRGPGLLNFLGHAPAGERAALWSDADRTRLAEVAQRHDPAGVFEGGLLYG